MRPPPPLAFAALALAAALAAWPRAAAAEARPPPAPRDHRDLKLYKRELADDRRRLDRLRARLDRLEALRSARSLDARALDELDRKVQEELATDSRKRLLEAKPALGQAVRVTSTSPQGGGPARYLTAADEARLERIALEWTACRGRLAPADLDARRALLAELVELGRVELEDDLRAYFEKGGDPASLPDLRAGEPGWGPR